MRPGPEDWLNLGGLMAKASDPFRALVLVKAYCEEMGLDQEEVTTVIDRATALNSKTVAEEEP